MAASAFESKSVTVGGARIQYFMAGKGAPLVWLHPLDSVGVNGVHALVIASTLVRVEMLRVGHTYDLFITQHSPGGSDHGKRPQLESKVLFRAHEGYLALDLVKENKDQRGSVIPAFHSRAGEVLAVPVEFEAVVEAITGAANCVGCRHSHYLQAPGQDDEDRIEAKASEVRA